MAREGSAGRDITLTLKFYEDGTLFNPYSITSVKVYDVSSGGTAIATLSAPTSSSVGIYNATYSIPTTLAQGTYYDEWIWTAKEGMASQTRRNSFLVSSNVITPDTATDVIPKSTGPLFVGSKEITFFNGITKELVQRIVAQKVIYYSVSEKHTKTHRLYDEAIKKTTYRPVEVNALILFQEPKQTVNKFTIDTIYNIEVYFHIHELEERRLIPREGDYLKYGTILYEIEKLNKPQLVYGQIDEQVMVKAVCRVARKSQFEVLDNIS